MTNLFGSDVKDLLQQDPPSVPNEAELLVQVRQKVGPWADTQKLLWHIRAACGKVHWAVNSYLRSVLAKPKSGHEDFDGKLPAMQHGLAVSIGDFSSFAAVRLQAAQPVAEVQQSAGSSSDIAPTAAAAPSLQSLSLDALPPNVVEAVLVRLDLASVVSAACACKILYTAAQEEQLWQVVFQQRWGAVVFPTSRHARCSRPCSRKTVPVFVEQDAAGGQPSAAISRVSTDSKPGALHCTVSDGPAAHKCQLGRLAVHDSNNAAIGRAAAGQLQATAVAAASSSAGSMRGSRSRGKSYISRWTGSTLSQRAMRPLAAAAVWSDAQEQGQQLVPASSQQSGKGTAQLWHQAGHLCQAVHGVVNGSCTVGSCSCAAGPSAPPAGSWQQQYKQQYSYQTLRKCPKCGVGGVLPIVYGFPSPALLIGVQGKRLVLGGDHLIESCHVWACQGCRSCFRYWPYDEVQLWMQDDAQQQQQQQQQAQIAASNSSSQAGDVASQQAMPDQGQGLATADPDDKLPRYTYEL